MAEKRGEVYGGPVGHSMWHVSSDNIYVSSGNTYAPIGNIHVSTDRDCVTG